MFFRLKKSGERGYVQIVENKRDGAAVRQRVIANLGRADELAASGALASLIASGAKLTDQVLLINALDEDAEGALSVAAKRIGGPMLFGRIWERLGVADVLADLAEGARVRVFGRARRVRRRPASAIRLGIGSRLLVVDGGLRHPRRRRARSASLLPGHGLARRGGGGEAGRGARAALRQGPDRGEAVRPPPRSLHRPLRRVHGHHQPLLLRRGRRDAGRARLLQGLSPRSEADDPRPRRRRRRPADLHRDVAGQYRRRDVAPAGRRPLAASAFPSAGSASSPTAA